MTARPHRSPGPDHPILIRPHAGRVVVRAGGKVIVDSRAALALREASYPVVLYLPRADADMAALTRTEHVTWCPYKGEASYFSIPAGGERGVNAVWTYETPFGAVESIGDHLAFYPDRVDGIDTE